MPVSFGLYYIEGLHGKSNWVCYRPANSQPTELHPPTSRRCVVFFPGDITDFFAPPNTNDDTQNVSPARLKENYCDEALLGDEGEHQCASHYPYSMEGLFWVLSGKFPYHDLVLIRPHFIFMSLSFFINFWPCDQCGTPRSIMEVQQMYPDLNESCDFEDQKLNVEGSEVEGSTTKHALRQPNQQFSEASKPGVLNVAGNDREVISTNNERNIENSPVKIRRHNTNNLHPSAAKHLFHILLNLYREVDYPSNEGFASNHLHGLGQDEFHSNGMDTGTTSYNRADDNEDEAMLLPSNITLVGFSKGAAVLSALLRDLPNLSHLFKSRIKQFHFLDPGLFEAGRIFELPENFPFLSEYGNSSDGSPDGTKEKCIVGSETCDTRNTSHVGVASTSVCTRNNVSIQQPLQQQSYSCEDSKVEIDEKEGTINEFSLQNLTIVLHGTPRQLSDPVRPFIAKEVDEFYNKLTASGVNAHKVLYYINCKTSLNMHFEIIKDFLVDINRVAVGENGNRFALPNVENFFFDEWERVSKSKFVN